MSKGQNVDTKAAPRRENPNTRQIAETQFVPHPVAVVFEFFSDPANLEAITPPWLNFRVVRVSTPRIQKGTLIDYKLRLRGLPLRWQSRIDDWQVKSHFVDVQTKGPYALWHHEHRFTAEGGGTRIHDLVNYRLPLGRFGNFCAGWFVSRDVRKIFAYRQAAIAKIFASEASSL